jgi:hypothetical protein
LNVIKKTKERTMPEETGRWRGISRNQWTLAAVIVALAIGGVTYRLLVRHELEQTAALFIGLPTILSLVLALTPKAKSSTGMALKGVTLALLMSAPILNEGFICILMAAPLFYAVAIVLGLLSDRDRRKRQRPVSMAVLLPLLLLSSLEGTTPALTFRTREVVTARKVVAGSVADVERTLAATPRFEAPLPPFLRLKFPLPAASRGAGLTVGSERVIHFAGGEGKPGDLTLRVTERGPHSVTFAAASDTSHIAHWLTWRTAHVEWRPAAGGKTEVTWTLVYDRELDPAWYFGPWERYATRVTAGYLIDTVATPAVR